MTYKLVRNHSKKKGEKTIHKRETEFANKHMKKHIILYLKKSQVKITKKYCILLDIQKADFLNVNTQHWRESRETLLGMSVHKYCTDVVHTHRREVWGLNCISSEAAGDREGFTVSESHVTARGRGVAKNNVRTGQMPLTVCQDSRSSRQLAPCYKRH